MAQDIRIGLAVLALSAAGLAGCETTRDAPAPAEVAAPDAQTPAQIEAASKAAYDAEAGKQPTDPVDAFVWRAGLCSHLGGEIGGDGSERDVEVQKTMEDLRCGADLAADGKALKAAHASDPVAAAKIEAALKAYAEGGELPLPGEG